MRIIAGEFKGRRLHAPRGLRIRPTSDRVREALFAMLGELEGERVLDLFAGSGALGIEAVSRGASTAVFVDSHAQATSAIRRNLDPLEIDAEVIDSDVSTYLRRYGGTPFDLVFVDPPYSSADRLAGTLSKLIASVVSEGGRIVTESDKHAPIELGLPLLKQRHYGRTRIAIYRASG